MTSETTVPVTDRASAIALCETIEDLAARLTDLLREETDLLKANALLDVERLQADKTELSTSYVKAFCRLRDNARIVGAEAPNQAARLKCALAALAREMEDNLAAIEAKRAVSQGLLGAIYEIARKKNAGPTCYTDGAAMANKSHTRSTAIAVDRAL